MPCSAHIEQRARAFYRDNFYLTAAGTTTTRLRLGERRTVFGGLLGTERLRSSRTLVIIVHSVSFGQRKISFSSTKSPKTWLTSFLSSGIFIRKSPSFLRSRQKFGFLRSASALHSRTSSEPFPNLKCLTQHFRTAMYSVLKLPPSL